MVFRGASQTPCDQGQAALRPFECPRRVSSCSEFFGYRRQDGQDAGSRQLVRIEHPDCASGFTGRFFVGAWADQAQLAWQLLEQGDVEEAMNPAEKISGTPLHRSNRGAVAPDRCSRGTSARHMRWFSNGLKNGSAKGCDTLPARQL